MVEANEALQRDLQKTNQDLASVREKNRVMRALKDTELVDDKDKVDRKSNNDLVCVYFFKGCDGNWSRALFTVMAIYSLI